MSFTHHIRSTCLIFLLFNLFVSAAPGAAAAGDRPPRVGLALSGGGARGAAHIGVLKALEREGVPIDCIAGTSFGALVGGLYALGYSPDEIEQILNRQDWNNIFSNEPERRLSPLTENKDYRYLGQLHFQGISPELPTGLYSGQKMIEVLNELTVLRMLPSNDDFDRLPIPFRAVATDLITGKPYIFSHGQMAAALRASMGIPMVFTPVAKDNMLLVDGGLSDNIPADVVRGMGADIVIAIDATEPLLQKKEIQSLVDVLDQSISLLMKSNAERSRPLADITLTPDLKGFYSNDFTRIPEIIDRGEKEGANRIEGLRKLLAGVPRRPKASPPVPEGKPVIDSVSFEGTKKVDPRQLKKEVQCAAGKEVDPDAVRGDLRRLYATRLFNSVDCRLDKVAKDRYNLVYELKESPLQTVGASLRYDRDYKFVALAEATSRQLFGTPSSATISAQFGGLENYSATLRYIPLSLPFLYLEPKVQLTHRERLDFQDGQELTKYTDKRMGGQLALGGTLLKRLEVDVSYRDEVVTISGGAAPNRLDGSIRLAGLTARAYRDTLDAQDFPSTGYNLRLQADKRSEWLGGDVGYSKYQADFDRYFSLTPVSTFHVRASAGFSNGDLPFFEQFYLGGYSFSEGGSRRVVGFDRDELAGRQMALLGFSYRRQIFSHPLSFTKRGFVTVLLNSVAISGRTTSPYEFAFANGAGIGLGFDTRLGPVRLVGAWGEGGRTKFYLSFGPGF
jgi:NTE family protein